MSVCPSRLNEVYQSFFFPPLQFDFFMFNFTVLKYVQLIILQLYYVDLISQTQNKGTEAI